MGQFPQWLYEQSGLQMRSGDKLLLFTDGLVEACNADEESFGERNLIRIARENPASSALDLMGLLIRAASQHSGEHFQDDASLIVLKSTEGATLDLEGRAKLLHGSRIFAMLSASCASLPDSPWPPF